MVSLNNSIIADKSFKFAKRIVFLYKQLTEEHNEYVMSKQILRSGTSIGANVKEALRGQSKKDFLFKLYISLKETDETEYWLNLLIDTGYIEKNAGINLLKDCQEISKILNAIIKTTKNNLQI